MAVARRGRIHRALQRTLYNKNCRKGGKRHALSPITSPFHVIFDSACPRVFMGMDFIWWSTIALEVVILVRASNARLTGRYLFFYTYIVCVLVSDIIRLCCYQLTPNLYPTLYWQTELVTIIASYAVMLEIFRHSVRHNPGVARLARNLLAIVFCLTLTCASLNLLHDGFTPSLARATADIGRYFRDVEGALLLGMLALFARYRIPLGRNVLGLILGNALWIGVNVVNLALWSLPGNGFSIALRKLRPATYLVALTIWCAALWSAQPDPVQPAENQIERDYEVLAARTRAILARTSNRLVRALKS
jgi:hypothetical protein